MKTTCWAGSISLVLASLHGGLAGEDPPPPLTAPTEAGPIVNPPIVTRPVVPPPLPRSLLRPKPTPATAPKPVPPRFETPAHSEELPPPLDAPAEMRQVDRSADPEGKIITSSPRGDGAPGLVLEEESPHENKSRTLPQDRNYEKIKPELPPQKRTKRLGLGLFPTLGTASEAVAPPRTVPFASSREPIPPPTPR